jgi:hypothetical protein
MGLQKCRIVGKSQWVLVILNRAGITLAPLPLYPPPAPPPQATNLNDPSDIIDKFYHMEQVGALIQPHRPAQLTIAPLN